MKRTRYQGIAILLLVLAAGSVRAVTPQVDHARVPTGILYDLVAPIVHVERFDGSTDAPAADAATLRQAVFELRHASLDSPAWSGDRAFRDDGDLTVRIGLVDVRYNRLRDEARASGATRMEGDRLVFDPTALETRRAFIAAPVRGYTYRGSNVSFVLDSSVFAGNSARPDRVQVDFDDGAGFRDLAWDRRVEVRYPASGDYVVRVRATGDTGATGEARFNFEVRALVTPAPNDTIPLTGTQSYNGGTATGRAFVFLAAGHTQLARPALVFEGFDIENNTNWDELYALLNQENLVEDLRTRGYDAVVLDFTDATDYIQRNAFVAVDLIHKVQAAIYSGNDFPLVGASMGGLVARYALAWMEQNSDPHRVRNFMSFDVPHRGANIPLGIQYWLDFFSGNSADAAHLLERLDRPAARQMLLYHHTDPPGATGQADPLKASFDGELSGLGGYPTQPRLVALSNGSGTGADQGFGPGVQIITYVYNPFPYDILGNVKAVPDGASATIFDGRLRIFFIGPTQSVTVSGTLPWDSAPGGSRNSMQQMDEVVAPYGDIIANYPSHCFIPIVSALDINTSDPFYDVDGDPNLLASTPFDNVFYSTVNEPHVTVTPANSTWILDEIDPPATAVLPAARTPTLFSFAVAPNPFGDQTQVRWRLARDSRVRVDVYDVAGHRVTTLVDGVRSAGPGEVRWTGNNDSGAKVSAGVYFVRVRAAGESQTRRLVLVR